MGKHQLYSVFFFHPPIFQISQGGQDRQEQLHGAELKSEAVWLK